MITKKKLIYCIALICINITLSFSSNYKIVPIKEERELKKQIEPSTMKYIYSRKNDLFEFKEKLSIFDSLIADKPFEIWSQKYDYEIIDFMRGLKKTHGIYTDTNVIKYFISLLDYPEKYYEYTAISVDTTQRVRLRLILNNSQFNKSELSYLHSNRWVNMAFRQLIHYTDLSLLQKYGKEIKQRIENRDWCLNKKDNKNKSYRPVYKNYKYELLSLLNLTEIEKKIIRNEKMKSPWISARLGNLSKQEVIINKYSKCVDYERKKEYAEYLYLIGSKKTIDVLINSFATTKVFKTSPLICKSFRYEILLTLTKINIQDSLFLRISENLLRGSICY